MNSSEVEWPDPDGLLEVAFDGDGMASGVVSDFVWTVLISEFISKPPEITGDGPLRHAAFCVSASVTGWGLQSKKLDLRPTAKP